jgi:hypothetical protein
MPTSPENYYSYMLRFWQTDETNPDQPVWLASLEIPGTSTQIGFSDIHALFDFLKAQTTRQPPPPPPDNKKPQEVHIHLNIAIHPPKD